MGAPLRTTQARCARRFLLFSALFGALLPAQLAARERKALQKVSSAPADPQNRAADSWLDQNAPAANHGGDTTLNVSSFLSANQRALVQFDLSSIPSSGIKAATLTLFLSTAPPLSRTYQAQRVTALWSESGVTWSNRLAGTAWTVQGGDFSGAFTATAATGTSSGTFLNWTLTSDVQIYFASASPSANYGTLISDQNEDNPSSAVTGTFSSKEDSTESHRPALTVDFIQDVQGLAAAPGDGQVLLSWSYPAAVGTVLSPTAGVLILRQAGTPIPGSVAPVDGVSYARDAACTNTLGGATVIFSSTSLPTQFDDAIAADNPDCPPADGTEYFYKVFTVDAAGDYSANGGTSNLTPMAAVMPNGPVWNQQAAVWIAAAGSGTLNAPGIIPSNVVTIGSPAALLFGVRPFDGTQLFGPASAGGGIQDQQSVLLGTDASIGHNVSYFAAADGFLYAVNATTGLTDWLANPTGLATNGFTTATPSVVVKNFAGAGYTRGTDLVVIGTRDTSTATGNQIVGVDGNSGAVVWQLIGGSGGTPDMDIVASTPVIDYANNAVWVTSHANGGLTQPSVWKVNPTNGLRLASAKLGDISSWPVVTPPGDVILVGTDAGVLYALNPADATTLASFDGMDGAIVGAPLLLNSTSPYIVVFSAATSVQAVIYDANSKTFTSSGLGTFRAATPGNCAPTAPLGFSGLPKVYFGCTDGRIYQINIAAGSVEASRLLSSGFAVGDLVMDVNLNLIIAGSMDGHVYAYAFPFEVQPE